MKTLIGLLGLTLFAVSSSAFAQAEKVDAYVKAEMQKAHIPGLSLAVVRDGKVVQAQGYGLSNVELNVAATPETIYQSGSIGKQFTATLVMMLVEEGKLGLDDHLTKYFPDAPESWKDITLRHVLTHTSGISITLYNKIDFRHDYTEDELLQEIQALPLDFQPGEKWSYSNTGYITLGILIHKVTGKFYGDLLREKIFEPLGMTTARIISEADIVPNRAAGYRLADGALKNQEWVAPMLNTTADGSLYFTVLDMAKWDAGLAAGKLLKKSSFDQMWTPVRLNDGTSVPYGFGWMIGQENGHPVIHHGGAWQGFSTHFARYVDQKLSVIVLTNLAGAGSSTIATGVARLYAPELTPAERQVAPIASRMFEPVLGEYELKPGLVLTISREGERLWAQATGQQRFELFPASQDTLFAKIADIECTFVRDASGKVTHLMLRQAGFETEAKKVR
jgi:CubicO group peptidase (beta-lactamase class C family)